MKKHNAFTLIELLTVIAIIGILAGILIPTVGAVRDSANKSRTRAQFSQWAASLNLFKQEYGFYPLKSEIVSSNKISPAGFIAALSARDYKGDKTSGSKDQAKAAGNRKLITFYSFSDSDIYKDLDTGTSEELVIDAFRNSEIAIFLDYNGDGKIDSDDGLSTSVSVRSGNGEDEAFSSGSWAPKSSDIPDDGVYSGVAFFSAGKGGDSKNVVMSWK